MRDREGNLWTTSLQGVSKIPAFHLATWRERHGLFEDEVTSVLERPDGSVVLGHRGGLTVLRDGVASVLPFDVDENSRPAARVL